MRKYVQLLLVVATVASVFLMLLYERKYSKVKMILDALNHFSYQEKTSKPRPSLQPTHAPYFTPIPSWFHLKDTLYLYSAYWHNSSENKEGATLVLATSDSFPDAFDLQCYLWYRDHSEALMGVVNVIKYASDLSDFFISCSHAIHHNVVPYGVTISYKSTDSYFITVNPFTEHFRMAVCLEALPVAFQDTILLTEFLIFYQKVGINYFVIYERGMSPMVRRVLEHAKEIGYHLDILQWNYPKQETGRNAELLNCFARSFLVHDASFVAFVKLGQYLVPKGADDLTSAVEKSDNIPSYKFRTYNFCSEFPVDIVAKTLSFPFLALKYMKRLNHEANSDVLAYRRISAPWNHQSSGKTQIISASDAILHTYGKCNLSQNQLSANYVEDTTMMKYKNTFFSSPLYEYVEKLSTGQRSIFFNLVKLQ